MAITSHSAYTAASATVLTTGLNSLANAANSAVSNAIDNSTTLDLYADFTLVVGAQTARTGTPTVELYITPAMDGANYDDANETINDKIGTFKLDTATNARRVTVRDVPIPPGLYKVYVRNLSSQTFAAAANTVSIRTHSLKTV